MPQLENTVSLTIVRLGEAVPVVFFSSAVDFILLVCAGGRQLLGRAAVDRRQLTGKMKSTALAIGMSGTASPRRTIVLSLAKANSVILGVSSVRDSGSSSVSYTHLTLPTKA